MFEHTHIRSKMGYVLIGLGVGSALGILFAPRSGKETRKLLAHKAEQTRKFAQHEVRDVRERAEDFVEQGRKIADQQKEFVSEAIDAGREAYRRIKSMAV